MAFLTKLITDLVLSLLSKLTVFLKNLIAKKVDKNKSDKIADDAKSVMDKAKTAKEIDEAADETLGGI